MNCNRFYSVATPLLLVAVCWHTLLNPARAEDWSDVLKQKQLLLMCSGKGSSLPYDAGVIKKAFEVLPALREQKVIIAGNSSGSILATYYSYLGFSQASVDYMAYKLVHADVNAIRSNESGTSKAAKLAQNKPTEISPEELREYIAFALNVAEWRGRSIAEIVASSKAYPKRPYVVVAANKEVVDNRRPDTNFSGKGYKVFDPSDYSVYWKPEVYEFYKLHPDKFAADNPDLKLGPTPYIGKACTCFVDKTMFELMSRIPGMERLCDLRLVTGPEDFALAIQSSTAEPSYFPPVPDLHTEKLMVGDQLGDLGNSVRRSYYGGFVMPLVGQDVRRMLPTVRVLGTGWIYVPIAARQLIKNWTLVDIRPAVQANLWWADMEIEQPRDLQNAMIARKFNAAQELEAGYERAAHCFATGRGLPEYVEPSKFDYPAEAAIVTGEPGVDFEPADPKIPGSRPRLLTLRGLGPLLKAPGTAQAEK